MVEVKFIPRHIFPTSACENSHILQEFNASFVMKSSTGDNFQTHSGYDSGQVVRFILL